MPKYEKLKKVLKNPAPTAVPEAPVATPTPTPTAPTAPGPLNLQDPGDPVKRKEVLANAMRDVENKNRQTNSMEISQQNQLKENKSNIIQQLFKILVDNGVDPNNMQSINEFLQKLAQQDPDLLKLFEYAFNNLLGNEFPSEGGPAGAQGAQSGGMMGQMGNLAQSVLMPGNPATSPATAGASASPMHPPTPAQPLRAAFSAPPGGPTTPNAFLNAQPSGGKPDGPWPPKMAPSQFQAEPPVKIKRTKGSI